MSYIMAVALVLTFTACGNKDSEVDNDNTLQVDAGANFENNNEEENKENNNLDANGDIESKVEENKPVDGKPIESKPNESKPVDSKPIESKPVVSNPVENKPVEELPEEKSEQPKLDETTDLTVGNILLKEFKEKAATSSDMVGLAETLVSNPIIQFAGATMEVEEGFLTGFGNNQVTGFKSGVMFAPIIGSIPFVGYVFELDEAADVSAFITTLEGSANLRWNICTEADEMVSGSVGNKVFFVMAPAHFED